MIIFIGFLTIFTLGILGITPIFSPAWWICWLIIGAVNIAYKAIRSGTPKRPDILVPPRGLGGYTADAGLDKVFPLGRSHVVRPPQGGGQSNSALLTLMALIEARIPKEEPLKSDDRYDEPQAAYPVEMEQEL